MSTYIIILDAPSEEAWQAVRDHWRHRHYIMNDYAALVTPEETTLTKDISQTVGITEGKNASGLVVELGHYHGFSDRALVEWLDKFS